MGCWGGCVGEQNIGRFKYDLLLDVCMLAPLTKMTTALVATKLIVNHWPMLAFWFLALVETPVYGVPAATWPCWIKVALDCERHHSDRLFGLANQSTRNQTDMTKAKTKSSEPTQKFLLICHASSYLNIPVRGYFLNKNKTKLYSSVSHSGPEVKGHNPSVQKFIALPSSSGFTIWKTSSEYRHLLVLRVVAQDLLVLRL